MPALKGYRRVQLPANTAQRSSVYNHGVRFEQGCDKPDAKKMKWACACSAKCRADAMRGKGAIFHKKNNTGNISRHLTTVHGEPSLGRQSCKLLQHDCTALLESCCDVAMCVFLRGAGRGFSSPLCHLSILGLGDMYIYACTSSFL